MADPSNELLVALRAQFGDEVLHDHCEGPIVAFRIPDSGGGTPIQLRFAMTEDAEVRALFLAERAIARKLSHNNIVAVLNDGVFEGHPYYAVRRLDPPLGDRMRDQRLPITDLLRVLRHVAAALAHCHEKGVVHGAIDPLHITYGPQGALLDGFHRAAFIEVFGSPYQEGIALGTPMYFSPELCSNQPIDARSDIYSLGIIAYATLAGEPPFLSADDWVRARLELDPPTPKLKSPQEKRLYSVIRQMVARDPAARFQSATAVLRALPDLPG